MELKKEIEWCAENISPEDSNKTLEVMNRLYKILGYLEDKEITTKQLTKDK